MCPLLMSGVQKLCNSFLSTRFDRKSVHIYDKKMLKKRIFAFFLHFFCIFQKDTLSLPQKSN